MKADDGRLLTFGMLGALLIGSATRGSPAKEGRELPLFALAGPYLDLDFDSVKLWPRIAREVLQRKARGKKFENSDMMVQVTPSDWQKLQAAWRLLPKIDERERQLAALQAGSGVPQEGKALLARIRKDSAEQKTLVEELLASLRSEIIDRARASRAG